MRNHHTAAGNRPLLLLSICLAAGATLGAQTGIITTVAGNGVGGYSGDNIPATSAALQPAQLSLDSSGNLYIADVYNSRIRLVNAATGIITTVAGGGTGGDGSLATNALLNNACGVKADSLGNLLISESCIIVGGPGGVFATFSRLRKVSGGVISTIAGGNGWSGFSGDGGPAALATLNVPGELTVDAAGNIYFADWYNHRVRRIDGNTQIITTVAGLGFPGFNGNGIPASAALLNGPTSVAVDLAGNLYIAEALSARVRKVDVTTGLITTIAGTGTAGFNGDGIPANTAALNSPQSVVVDAVGNVYFSDTTNGRVRKVDAITGLISTVAGGGGGGMADGVPATSVWLNGPRGLALSADGKLYISEHQANRVRMVVLPTGVATSAALVVSPNPATPGQTVTFTTTVTPAAATGTVTLSSPGSSFGSAPVVNGIASYSTTMQTGQFTINAQYSGGPGYQAATSAPVSLEVKHPTTVTLVSSLNPAAWLQPVTFTATLGSTYLVTGTIQFFDGAISLGTVALSNRTAMLTNSSLAPGNHAITAVYSGDSTSLSSTSPVLTQSVNATSTLTLSASTLNPAAAQPVTFTATATPSTAIGVVEFLDGATVMGTGSLSAGIASFTTSSLVAGLHVITARYAGDASTTGSTSTAVNVTVKAASAVTLLAAPNPASLGNSVTFTATVTPATATGTVEFLDGTTVIGSGSLSAGVASYATSTLTAGSHPISARYTGDVALSASTSAAVSVTVKAASTVTLSANPTAATLGSAVTLTASVTPATATGTVEFLDGATVIGSGSLSAGTATLATSTLATGPHTITARFPGDSALASSTSLAVSVTVKAASTVTLSANPTPATVGSPVTLTATVTPATATGTVQFLDGGAILGTGALAGGVATFTTSTLGQYTHNTLTADYSGDAQTGTSSASAVSLVVLGTSSVEVVASTPTPGLGQSVTFTAFVNPSGTTGTVQFFDNGAPIGSGPISGGAAQATTSALTLGAHTITATYSGSTTHAGSTSPGLPISVKTGATLVLTSSANPSLTGQSVTFTATANSGATGTIQFQDGGVTLGSATLSGGVATLTTASLTAGSHVISFTFPGDASYYPGGSNTVTQTVKSPSTLGLVSNANPAAPGQSVTFTATVTPATATGTVVFLVNGASVASPAIAGGVATYSTSSLASGTQVVTAQYAGDASVAASNAAPVNQVVKTATTAVAVSSANPSLAGQNVTFTATIAPAATGSVQFLDNGTMIATATLASGVATMSTSALAVGSHSITVVYGGSGTHMGSTSAALAQAVNKVSSSSAVSSSLNPSATGQAVTFTVAVTPATATGTVQIKDGATTLATVTLAGGTASYTTSTLAAGSHAITAVYSGDATTNASTSAALSQSVRTATTLSLTSSRNPSRTIQSLTFTANVSPSAATGTVQFFDGATLLGTSNVSSGRATLTKTGMSVATHPIQAVYSGSANHAPSTSTVLNQSITN